MHPGQDRCPRLRRGARPPQWVLDKMRQDPRITSDESRDPDASLSEFSVNPAISRWAHSEPDSGFQSEPADRKKPNREMSLAVSYDCGLRTLLQSPEDGELADLGAVISLATEKTPGRDSMLRHSLCQNLPKLWVLDWAMASRHVSSA